MQGADPAALAIGLGLLAGPLGALAARRGRRLLGAALGAGAGGFLAAAFGAAAGGLLAPAGTAAADGLLSPELAGLAAFAGAATALALPGLATGGMRRRSFGAAYPRAPFAGELACAALPARCAGVAPSALLDAADRLRLESALCDAERKSGGELAVSLVASAAAQEGARWRAGVWLGALALCVALAAGAPPLAVFAAAAAGVLAGRLLARAARVRRLFVTEAALASSAGAAALDAFAHAALARAPRQAGALVFVALAEARVVALADRGFERGAAAAMAAAAAGGLAAGRALEGLVAAFETLEGPGAAAAPLPEGAPPRPHPVRVED